MHTHHAILLIGPHDACLSRIPEEYRSGPDSFVHVAERLTIEAARVLRLQAQSRPVQSDKRRFVISCTEFNREAQNALLKLFEDPPSTSQFYIITPRLSALLPTVRSRLALEYVADADTTEDPIVEAFIGARYAARLAQVGKLASAKDTAGMRTLIAGIERAAVRTETPAMRSALADVALASTYSSLIGGSPKMLLEHLALSLPEGKG